MRCAVPPYGTAETAASSCGEVISSNQNPCKNNNARNPQCSTRTRAAVATMGLAW